MRNCAIAAALMLTACVSTQVDGLWGPVGVFAGTGLAALMGGPAGLLVATIAGAALTITTFWVTAPQPPPQGEHHAGGGFSLWWPALAGAVTLGVWWFGRKGKLGRIGERLSGAIGVTATLGLNKLVQRKSR